MYCVRHSPNPFYWPNLPFSYPLSMKVIQHLLLLFLSFKWCTVSGFVNTHVRQSSLCEIWACRRINSKKVFWNVTMCGLIISFSCEPIISSIKCKWNGNIYRNIVSDLRGLEIFFQIEVMLGLSNSWSLIHNTSFNSCDKLHWADCVLNIGEVSSFEKNYVFRRRNFLTLLGLTLECFNIRFYFNYLLLMFYLAVPNL